MINNNEDSVLTINFGTIYKELLSFKYFIIGFTSLISIIGVIYSLSIENKYKSSVLLAVPIQSPNSSFQLANGLNQLPGVNNILGGVNPSAEIAYERISSRDFLSSFIDKYDLTKYILAGEKYKDRIIIFDDTYNESLDKWKDDKPSIQSALREFLDKNIEFKKDFERGFLEVSIEYLSPELSKQWLENLVKDINENIKEKDLTKSQNSVIFLENKLEEVNDVNIDRLLSRLLEEEYKKIMLANSSDEYFFETIDPPIVAEKKSSPARSIICIFFFLIGSTLSILLVLFKDILGLKIKNSIFLFVK